jgi:hypothetical protein
MITAACACHVLCPKSQISHDRHSKCLDKVRNEPFREMQHPLARQEGMPCTKPKRNDGGGWTRHSLYI